MAHQRVTENVHRVADCLGVVPGSGSIIPALGGHRGGAAEGCTGCTVSSSSGYADAPSTLKGLSQQSD
jgi:hypothetical protein